MAGRIAQFKLIEVSPGVWSIRATHLDQEPGRSADGGFIIRVVGIPDSVKSEAIANRLARLVDLQQPPLEVAWVEQEQEPGQ